MRKTFFGTLYLCEVILNPLINVGTSAMTVFFKNSHNDLDLDYSTLKAELAWDIIIPNICVKLN